MSPVGDQPDILKKLADLVVKIKTPAQLVGFVEIIIAVVLLARSSLVNAAGIFGLGMLLLVFGQIFAHLDKIPEGSRTVLLLRCLLLFILAFALNLIFAFIVLAPPKSTAATSVSSVPAIYPPAEQKIVDLKCEVEAIRAAYMTLQDRPDRSIAVNVSARQLADRALAVDDGQLSLGMQIYKYEDVAYSLAMVAGSEDPPEEKLKTTEEIIKATEQGNKLVEDAMRPGSLDTPKIRDMRDWIIRDNASARLHRLEAIALCVRWQVRKNPADRLQVRKIIHDLPYGYLQGEQPQNTSELRPCFVDNEPGSQPSPH